MIQKDILLLMNVKSSDNEKTCPKNRIFKDVRQDGVMALIIKSGAYKRIAMTNPTKIWPMDRFSNLFINMHLFSKQAYV